MRQTPALPLRLTSVPPPIGLLRVHVGPWRGRGTRFLGRPDPCFLRARWVKRDDTTTFGTPRGVRLRSNVTPAVLQSIFLRGVFPFGPASNSQAFKQMFGINGSVGCVPPWSRDPLSPHPLVGGI
jgi:hypothetical protein